MKKVTKILVFVFLFTMFVNAFQIREVEAKTKSKSSVVWTLKNGTLTVKGKGAMTKKTVFKGNKKIKKVVIKKGVTSIYGEAFRNCKNLKSVKIGNNVKTIGKYAFYNCKNLKSVIIGNRVNKIGRSAFGGTAIKKLVIPKSVKTIGLYAFTGCKNLNTVTMPGKNIKVPVVPDGEYPRILPHVKKIKFSTNLTINSVTFYDTENYIVSKRDSNYKSVNGVIYTKNGKRTVRLPNRQVVNITEGCTEFTMESLMYSGYLGDDMHVYNCYALKKIVLPKTVNKILVGKNFDIAFYKNPQFTNAIKKLSLESVVIKNKEIGKNNIEIFTSPFSEDFNVEYIENQNADNVIKFTKKDNID